MQAVTSPGVIYVLFALTSFVLLLACANLANPLLARSAARQREMSVRLALGASRGRILRQVLSESLLLSSLGGMAGFALGYLGRNLVPQLLSSAWRHTELNTGFDVRIFALTASISIITGILSGLAPAWQAPRADVNAGLKDSAASATQRRKGFAGRLIVVFQVALSLLLAVGAGLFSRTFVNLSAASLGFDPHNLLLLSIQAPPSRYPAPQDIALHHRIEDRLSQIPGVQSVTLTEEPLLANNMNDISFQPLGQAKLSDDTNSSDVNGVGQNFFQTYRIPILYGRAFASTDTSTSPLVGVINQANARKFFSGISPIGKTFNNGSATDKRIYQIIQIIAVANLPAEQIETTIVQERLFATLTAAFGVLALILACIGIYGIMAYTVARRTSEIGVRMALGARAGQVLVMILGESSWLAILGIAVGLVAAFGLTRLVSNMLYGLQATDPATLVGASLLLLMVAFAAAYGPARRASRIDPMQALRRE